MVERESTPSKTNMEPEQGLLEKETYLQTINFLIFGVHLGFRGFMDWK